MSLEILTAAPLKTAHDLRKMLPVVSSSEQNDGSFQSLRKRHSRVRTLQCSQRTTVACSRILAREPEMTFASHELSPRTSSQTSRRVHVPKYVCPAFGWENVT